MKLKWSVEVVTRKEKSIAEQEMNERLAAVWELLHSLAQSPPALSLPKADITLDVTKDSQRKRSAS